MIAPAQPKTKDAQPSHTSGDRFPSAFTILFALNLCAAVLTWIIPAGQYDRAMTAALGKETPVPGSYQTVDGNPQGILQALRAPIAGFYDPATYAANAIDV